MTIPPGALSTDTKITFRLPVVDSPIGDLLDPIQGRVVGRARGVEIITPAPTADLAHITNWAAERGIELEGLSVSRGDLEDAYLELLADADTDADENDDAEAEI